MASNADILCHKSLAVSAWTLQCPRLHEASPDGDADLNFELSAHAADSHCSGAEIDLAISQGAHELTEAGDNAQDHLQLQS